MDCCTLWFEGWWRQHCCNHDKDYYKSGLSRKKADYYLFKGVLYELYNRIPDDIKYSKLLKYLTFIPSLPIASIMWVGVRLLGRNHYTRKQKITIEKLHRG